MHIPQALSIDQNNVTLCLTDPHEITVVTDVHLRLFLFLSFFSSLSLSLHHVCLCLFMSVSVHFHLYLFSFLSLSLLFRSLFLTSLSQLSFSFPQLCPPLSLIKLFFLNSLTMFTRSVGSLSLSL